jgi:hypothetical protein
MKYWQFFMMMAAIYIAPGMSDNARIGCAAVFLIVGAFAMFRGY